MVLVLVFEAVAPQGIGDGGGRWMTLIKLRGGAGGGGALQIALPDNAVGEEYTRLLAEDGLASESFRHRIKSVQRTAHSAQRTAHSAQRVQRAACGVHRASCIGAARRTGQVRANARALTPGCVCSAGTFP